MSSSSSKSGSKDGSASNSSRSKHSNAGASSASAAKNAVEESSSSLLSFPPPSQPPAAAAAPAASPVELNVPSAEEFLTELVNELDERAAADDEQLFLAYEGVNDNNQLTIENNNNNNMTAAAAADRVNMTLVCSPATSDPYIPAISLSPLTPAQRSIASQLSILDLSESSSENEAASSSPVTANSPAYIRSHSRYALIHPLWIAHGKKQFEVLQQKAAEAAKAAAEAALHPPSTSANNLGEAEAAAVASANTQQHTPNASARGGNERGTRSSAGRSASRTGAGRNSGGTNEEDESRGRRGNNANSAALANSSSDASLSPAVPPPQPSMALGTAVVAARSRRIQESLQESHRIPIALVSPIPIMPDNEYWHLKMERHRLSTGVTTLSLTLGSHGLLWRRVEEPVSGAVATSIAFDGQRFREVFKGPINQPFATNNNNNNTNATSAVPSLSSSSSPSPAAQSSNLSLGCYEDGLRFDARVWQSCREWIDNDLLAPLSLPPGRLGWCTFWEEYLPFDGTQDSCRSITIQLQQMRGLFDAPEPEEIEREKRKFSKSNAATLANATTANAATDKPLAATSK